MIGADGIALIGFTYIFILFLIAYVGDKGALQGASPHNSNFVYALSLAVYCSSWTFYGAVGTAVVDGLDYLAIYLGPCLVFLFGYPLVRRIILICKQNSITTISDFLSSRYGKSRRIATIVTVMAVAGSLPYIALQLKAVSSSYFVLSAYGQVTAEVDSTSGLIGDNVALVVAIGLVLFTVLFGTRHLDATEHHKGMILAIAFESVVKLLAILAVGYYAIYLLTDSDTYNNISDFVASSELRSAFGEGTSTWSSFLTKSLLSMTAIILLPRQFQVAVVEARDHHQFKTAMWIMPVYLILTSVIVIPIALSGILLLPNSQEDLYVLSLPLAAGNNTLAIIAFIGGLSAATGMVIVAAISLSTMVCNDLVMPLLIRRNGIEFLKRGDLNNIVLLIRRFAIAGLMLGAYGYYKLIDTNQQLANIGLVSFAAIAQFLPATLFALYWRGAHSRGVFWGLAGGFSVWAYTLILPTIIDHSTIERLFDGSWLHPEALLGWSMGSSLTHGVFWSLGVNLCLIVFFSFRESQSVIEKLQASRFFYTGSQIKSNASDNNEGSYEVSPDDLFIIAERITGARSSRALFAQYEKRMNVDLATQAHADQTLIAAVQKAIAGVIGTASAQRLISDTLLGDQEFLGELTHLVDETSDVLKFNRNLLQTTLQNITHGIAVVDDNLNLVVWNDTYLKMFGYPESFIYVGKPIKEVFDYSAERGDFAGKDPQTEIEKRIRFLQQRSPYTTVRHTIEGLVIKATGEPMPEGGFVTTYEDITDSVNAAELLKKANEELETRVQERTLELEALTKELERNTRSKTHFLAAASHDLLQPINAARLFAHSISERAEDATEVERLSKNIDQSLATANELLRALLDISKLDAGGIEPEPANLGLHDFLQNIRSEMLASAQDKGVTLTVEAEPIYVNTDRQLLISVLLNLVANALRYTPETGSVALIAAKNDQEEAEILVCDTGMGIKPKDLKLIFNEFYQVKDNSIQDGRGLGLGLSIVKRICRLLNIAIHAESVVGEGSIFTLTLPTIEAPKRNVPEDAPSAKPSSPEFKLLGTKVMCLDNDEAVLNAMQTLLEGWGCEVVRAMAYQEALSVIERHELDLVLVDYRLDGEETGLDILRHGRQRSSSLKGVLITAEQDKSLKPLASDLGFMYLDKPLEPAALKSLMMYMVSER